MIEMSELMSGPSPSLITFFFLTLMKAKSPTSKLELKKRNTSKRSVLVSLFFEDIPKTIETAIQTKYLVSK